MAGEANRKVFFNDRNLDLSGYRILLGGLPRLEDINMDSSLKDQVPEHVKRILLLSRTERLADGAPIIPSFFLPTLISLSTLVLPLLLEDVNRRMKDWGTEGKLNPFNEVYDVCSIRVFSLNVVRNNLTP